MNVVYAKKNFKIYAAGDEGFIIHNVNKEFKDGHTHINHYKTARYIVDLSVHRSIPHHLNSYFLESLRRISDDETYASKLEELISAKKKRKPYYRNVNKGAR